MTTPDVKHLTADELDALLEGSGDARTASHLGTCTSCREMAALDARVILALNTLPILEPAPGFEDRVMARVQVQPRAVAAPAVQVRSPRELAARRRFLVGGVLAGGVVAGSVAWAAADPNRAHGWAMPAIRETGAALWLWLQTLAANTTEQPWFDTARNALATPLRALLYTSLFAGAYAAVLTGFRRILTEPTTNAGW